MRKIALVLLPAFALGIAPAFAQSASSPAQSGQGAGAPPHSGEASGHDAQAGRPPTAPAPESTGSVAGQKKSDLDEANRSMAEEAKKQKK